MRWPLRNQMFVPFAVLLVVVLVAVSVINSYLAATRTSRQIIDQLQRVAEVFRTSSFPITEPVLQQARGLSGAQFVLTNEQGQPESTTISALMPADVARELGPGHDDAFVTLNGQRYFRVGVSLDQRTDRPRGGRLHVLYDEAVLRDARWRAAFPPLLIGIVAVALVGGIAHVLAGRVSRPIVELQANFARVASGQFEPLDLPPRNDEIRDLIESRNRLVGELNSLRQAMQRSERLALLGQLSGGLSHHLRNAIAGAKLALQLHQRHCRAEDPSSLEVALRQLQLTEDHLRQLLTVGQPTEPRREPCDLRAIVEEVLSLLGPTARHRKVTLTVEPTQPAALPLVADASQLRQLVVNLVVNAIEATSADGWVRIELRHDMAENIVRLRVVDSGPGPAESIRARLFEPFTTGKPEGVGLGLTVARQVAEQHGGQLRLLAQRPTCFELELPAARIAE